MIALAQAFFTNIKLRNNELVLESYSLKMRRCERSCMGAFVRDSTDKHVSSITEY